MLTVAVSWDLYVQTKSALVLGNVGFVQVAPFLLFALFTGGLADRVNRQNILIVTQILFLFASGLLIYGFHSVATIYACLFFTAAARAFQWPARLSILPHTVPPEALGNAIAWNSSAQEIASISGPGLAGLLLWKADSRTIYILQAGCAILTLVCYILIRYRGEKAVESTTRNPQSLLEGMRFVRDNKLILSVISLDLFAVLFGGATALLPIYADGILHVGAQGLGWLRAAPSVGSVSMALCLAHSGRIRQAGRVLLWAVAGFGAATMIFGVSRSFWLSFGMLLLIGAFDNISVVLRQSLVQRETPDQIKGRVMAVNGMFISSSNQFGAVESGWTAHWFGPVTSVVTGGVGAIVVVLLCAVLSAPLRNWKQ